MSAAGSTWAGTHEFGAPTFVDATSVEQVQHLVASARHVRALGTRHSFNDIADTVGTLVTVTGIDPAITIDESARTVTAGAGARFGVIAAALEHERWALHNMGSLPHISVAGAISTGTHGSGNRNGSLSTAVRALEFVGHDGELRIVRHGEPDFEGSVVALGALGIVVRVTLAIEPTYLVRQDEYRGVEWDAVLAEFDSVTGAGHSVSLFTDWVSPLGHIWVKRRMDDGRPPGAADILGVRATAREITPADANLTEFGSVGPWSLRLPHFRLDSEPSVGEEIQTEYFVAVEHAPEALTAVRTLGPVMSDHLVGTEIRTVAADSLWLSPAYERDVVGIHFTWKDHRHEVAEILPRLESVLAEFAARPHWGKAHSMTAHRIAPLYPRMNDMHELIARTDPDAKFSSPHLDRVLGLRALERNER